MWEGMGGGGNNCDLRVRSELVENVNTASSRVNKPVRATTNTQSQRKIKQNVPLSIYYPQILAMQNLQRNGRNGLQDGGSSMVNVKVRRRPGRRSGSLFLSFSLPLSPPPLSLSLFHKQRSNGKQERTMLMDSRRWRRDIPAPNPLPPPATRLQ